ncbi:hypothetical protein JCM3774_004559, partial [Rhodotorula dairenensis]
RAIFLPELPYLSMRLSPPSAILTRLEYVAAVRRMLWAHGFGLTCLEKDDDDDDDDDESSSTNGEGEGEGGHRRLLEDDSWRRAKAIVLAHSFGTEAAAWLLRDAADIVAGTVLVDPMSVFLHACDLPRNFFRTRSRTASEHFFAYFARECAIRHYLSRHLRWTDALVFAGERGPAALPDRVVRALVPRCAQDPLEPPFDVPNYAPFVTPCPAGPLPTVVFLSERDCIVPVDKVRTYLEAAGFSTGSSLSLPTDVPTRSKSLEGPTDGRQSELPNGSTLGVSGAGSDDSPLNLAASNSSLDPPPPPSPPPHEKVLTPAKTTASPSPAPSLYIMPRFEHGAILARPAWCRRVKDAIDRVELAASAWEASDE